MNWLHFIGKQYYTMNAFESEAREYQVSRRIALDKLKKMKFGDKIYLFQKARKSHNSIVFGYFTFERILGQIPESLTEELLDEGHLTQTMDFGEPRAGTSVIRGCGSYIMGTGYILRGIDAPALADKLQKYGATKVMIGGTFFGLPHIASDIKFQMGFRPFDYDRFIAEYQRLVKLGRQRICIKGCWYISDGAKTTIRSRDEQNYKQGINSARERVRAIHDYQKKISTKKEK